MTKRARLFDSANKMICALLLLIVAKYQQIIAIVFKALLICDIVKLRIIVYLNECMGLGRLNT